MGLDGQRNALDASPDPHVIHASTQVWCRGGAGGDGMNCKYVPARLALVYKIKTIETCLRRLAPVSQDRNNLESGHKFRGERYSEGRGVQLSTSRGRETLRAP